YRTQSIRRLRDSARPQRDVLVSSGRQNAKRKIVETPEPSCTCAIRYLAPVRPAMPADNLSEVLPLLPQAAARVDVQMRLLWLEPDFAQKTGIVLEEGQSLLDALERGPGRDAL